MRLFNGPSGISNLDPSFATEYTTLHHKTTNQIQDRIKLMIKIDDINIK